MDSKLLPVLLKCPWHWIQVLASVPMWVGIQLKRQFLYREKNTPLSADGKQGLSVSLTFVVFVDEVEKVYCSINLPEIKLATVTANLGWLLFHANQHPNISFHKQQQHKSCNIKVKLNYKTNYTWFVFQTIILILWLTSFCSFNSASMFSMSTNALWISLQRHTMHNQYY